MKKTILQGEQIKLIGITVRTNNKNEVEQPFTNGKIWPLVQRYFHEKLFEKIPNRKNPGTTYCVYTEYESDHTGDYTYLIGEEVTSFSDIPSDLIPLTIAPQTYAKFTTEPGSMPSVLGNAWQEIWKMTDRDFGSPRLYHADFEVYDERAADHTNMVLDLYIGLKPINS